MEQNEARRRLNRTALVTTLIAIALFMLAQSSSFCIELLTGWLHFAMRVVPKVRVRLDGIAIFAVGMLLACALTHFFLRWLVRESQLKRNVRLTPWRASSSVSLVAIILLVFAIGISMAGIVHQVGWIISSPKGLYTSEIQTEEDASRSPYQPGVVAVGNQVSWIFEILPYLPAMKPEIDRSKPWNEESNKAKLNGLVIQVFCPSQGHPHKAVDGLGLTHVVQNRELKSIRNIENASQTIMAGEIQLGFSPWEMPNNGRLPKHGIRNNWSDVPNESLGFGSSHISGANMLMADDSVSFLSVETDPKVLEQLGQPKFKNREIGN